MRTDDPPASTEDEATILRRMLRDAEALCATTDPLLAGQFIHLRGRISALVAMTASLDEGAER